jgi:transposase
MVQEILSIVERRRRWSTEDRVRILEEASRPSVVIASVLARHQVSGALASPL